MPFRIAVIPGDGIGPEVITQGIRVLEGVIQHTGSRLEFETYDLGAERYLRTGEIIPEPIFAELQSADAIYLGAVGDPRVKDPQYAARLLLRLRFELDLWVNLRPSRLLAPGLTPLRDAASIDAGQDAGAHRRIFVSRRDSQRNTRSFRGAAVARRAGRRCCARTTVSSPRSSAARMRRRSGPAR